MTQPTLMMYKYYYKFFYDIFFYFNIIKNELNLYILTLNETKYSQF